MFYFNLLIAIEDISRAASLTPFRTILSYIATAVTSADSAIQYLNFLLFDHANGYQVNPLWATIGACCVSVCRRDCFCDFRQIRSCLVTCF